MFPLPRGNSGCLSFNFTDVYVFGAIDLLMAFRPEVPLEASVALETFPLKLAVTNVSISNQHLVH